jgi:predicted Zn-dependent peptidase
VEFKSEKLDNGLEVIAEINSEAFSSSIGYFVKTGSRDETPAMAGVSHFLEHMLFKGTARRTAADVNRELDDLGSQSNAYTSEEQTVYYVTVLPEFQEQAVDLLSDMMRPALREEDFETERQVILEEIAMYDDQPPYGAMERIMEEFFGDHPLARRVLGTQETVRGLATEDMRAYHAARYAPNNLCLVGAGKVDFDALVAQARALTGHWTPRPIERVLSAPSPKRHQTRMEHPSAVLQYTIEYAQGPSKQDPKRFATRLLTTVLGDETGSRLFWALVDSGRADSAALFTQEFQDCGLLGGYLACAPEDTQDNWKVFQQIIQEAARQKVTAEELTLAKNKTCSSLALNAERPSSRLFTVGNAWTLRHTYENIQQAINHYKRVTLNEVQQALSEWLHQERVTVTVAQP